MFSTKEKPSASELAERSLFPPPQSPRGPRKCGFLSTTFPRRRGWTPSLKVACKMNFSISNAIFWWFVF